MSDNKNFIVQEHSRSDEQRRVHQEILDAGVCPFCPENLMKYHKQDVLMVKKHWLVTNNQWPYENTKNHILLIARVHAERLSDLPVGAGDEIIAIGAELERTLETNSGGMFMRFGHPEYNGGTVRHLHFQIVTPDLTKEWDSIKVKLGSRPKKVP